MYTCLLQTLTATFPLASPTSNNHVERYCGKFKTFAIPLFHSWILIDFISQSNVYRYVIDDVINQVRGDFEDMGIDDSILQELQRVRDSQ